MSTLCANNHERVVYEGEECPGCAANLLTLDVASLVRRVDELQAYIIALEAERH